MIGLPRWWRRPRADAPDPDADPEEPMTENQRESERVRADIAALRAEIRLALLRNSRANGGQS